ncbi:hypothetical protein FKM82_007929 [Ascaphus truei]
MAGSFMRSAGQVIQNWICGCGGPSFYQFILLFIEYIFCMETDMPDGDVSSLCLRPDIFPHHCSAPYRLALNGPLIHFPCGHPGGTGFMSWPNCLCRCVQILQSTVIALSSAYWLDPPVPSSLRITSFSGL